MKDTNIQYQEYLISMRRYFHQHPEPSLQETNTLHTIQKELTSFGIEPILIPEGGIYAEIKGNKKVSHPKCIALRADIDALNMQDLKDVPYRSIHDGYCHACGHDGHTATLLTVAKLLSQKKDEFGGLVKLFFQQGEEIGKGARKFIQAGLMEHVDRVFGFHVSNNIHSPYIALTPGPQNASVDYFKIKIYGKGAHVSQPHLGIDALYIASQIVVALQSIVSRNTDPLDTVLVGIGTLHSGTQYNIIAKEATIEGTTRAFSKQSRDKTNTRIQEIATHIATMYQARVEFEFVDGTPPLINDPLVTQEVSTLAASLFGEDTIIHDFEKTLAGDNIADYLEHAPGCYAFVGTRNENIPGSDASQHNGEFDIDEESLYRAATLMIEYTLSILK